MVLAPAPTALICGVSGQDGAYLAQLLLAKGYRVIGTSRDAGSNSFENLARLGIRDEVTVASMAIRDFGSVLQVLERFEPTEIYNVSGQSSVGQSFEQPMEAFESMAVGTLNLLEAIRRSSRGIRFYNSGSGECFGDTGELAADEETPFRPRSPYAVAKAAAFWQVANYREAYGLFACSGILFNHESPLRPERFVTRKVVRAACRIASGSPERLALGNVDVHRDWGWAPEYVDAVFRMLQQDTPEDFVIATGKTHSLRELVATAFSAVDLDWQEHVDADPTLMRPTDPRYGHANPAKAARLLGWRASMTMEDVVRNMVAAELGRASKELGVA